MKNLICISAPSGSGKTTLCKVVRSINPELIWSVSYTTRKPRSSEVDGEDYNFISMKEFERLIDKGHFAEWENVHGNYYGTVKSGLDDAILKNKLVLLELDVKGTESIQKLYPENSYSIFIVPPSIESLRMRLQKRGSETEESIERRLASGKKRALGRNGIPQDVMGLCVFLSSEKSDFMSGQTVVVDGGGTMW